MAVAAPDRHRSLERVAAILKSVGHPVRLRLLAALHEEGELTVSELQRATGADQATVSRQLGVLRARHVVRSRREGINVHYRILEPRVHAILECLDPLASD